MLKACQRLLVLALVRVLALVCLPLTFGSAAAENAGGIDKATGLILADGWQEVQVSCTSCHSAQLITQNAGTRILWQSRLMTMYETHGMPRLDESLANRILDYLADNYPQRQASRRRNLPTHLLPP